MIENMSTPIYCKYDHCWWGTEIEFSFDTDYPLEKLDFNAVLHAGSCPYIKPPQLYEIGKKKYFKFTRDGKWLKITLEVTVKAYLTDAISDIIEKITRRIEENNKSIVNLNNDGNIIKPNINIVELGQRILKIKENYLMYITNRELLCKFIEIEDIVPDFIYKCDNIYDGIVTMNTETEGKFLLISPDEDKSLDNEINLKINELNINRNK